MNQYFKSIETLLDLADLASAPNAEWKALSGDGSDRVFFRIGLQSGKSCVAVFPSSSLDKKEAFAESNSTYLIGKHLNSKGVCVPNVYAYDEASGGILFEDLGNVLLYNCVVKGSAAHIDHYKAALKNLAVFQVKGIDGFREEFCWDTPRYDSYLMLSRESGYFKKEFCQDYLGMDTIDDQLDEDFKALAGRVGQEDSQFLLHRDFQSRNLMIKTDQVYIIDFQGARLGPLGYDLASLLNDPYVCLPPSLKEELLEYYIKAISQHIFLDAHQFKRGYFHIALQRNLQVLGAFAFLSKKKNKPFFHTFISPAYNNLFLLVTESLSGRYPALENLVREMSKLINCS